MPAGLSVTVLPSIVLPVSPSPGLYAAATIPQPTRLPEIALSRMRLPELAAGVPGRGAAGSNPPSSVRPMPPSARLPETVLPWTVAPEVPTSSIAWWCQLLPDLLAKPRQPSFVPPQSGVRRLPLVPSRLPRARSRPGPGHHERRQAGGAGGPARLGPGARAQPAGRAAAASAQALRLPPPQFAAGGPPSSAGTRASPRTYRGPRQSSEEAAR